MGFNSGFKGLKWPYLFLHSPCSHRPFTLCGTTYILKNMPQMHKISWPLQITIGSSFEMRFVEARLLILNGIWESALLPSMEVYVSSPSTRLLCRLVFQRKFIFVPSHPRSSVCTKDYTDTTDESQDGLLYLCSQLSG